MNYELLSPESNPELKWYILESKYTNMKNVVCENQLKEIFKDSYYTVINNRNNYYMCVEYSKEIMYQL